MKNKIGYSIQGQPNKMKTKNSKFNQLMKGTANMMKDALKYSKKKKNCKCKFMKKKR